MTEKPEDTRDPAYKLVGFCEDGTETYFRYRVTTLIDVLSDMAVDVRKIKSDGKKWRFVVLDKDGIVVPEGRRFNVRRKPC